MHLLSILLSIIYQTQIYFSQQIWYIRKLAVDNMERWKALLSSFPTVLSM